MGEYRRFVSYLYGYRNGKKEQNAGAVRVDCRGAQTQIRIGIRENPGKGQAVLLGSGIPEQPIGRILRNAGAGGEVLILKDEKMPHEFSAYSGLEIRYGSEDFCLRTFWDDRMKAAEEGKKMEAPEKETLEKEKQEDPREEAGEKEQEEEKMQEEEEREEEENMEESVSEREVKEIQALSLREPEPEEVRLTWEQLGHIYPSVRPFGEDDGWEALRIRLQDIGRLPREYWKWGNCPFVEMAYRDYGSLLLLRDPVNEQIYLGVPGSLPLQEFRVADLFGFRSHREGRKVGYYLARIKL